MCVNDRAEVKVLCVSKRGENIVLCVRYNNEDNGFLCVNLKLTFCLLTIEVKTMFCVV